MHDPKRQCKLIDMKTRNYNVVRFHVMLKMLFRVIIRLIFFDWQLSITYMYVVAFNREVLRAWYEIQCSWSDNFASETSCIVPISYTINVCVFHVHNRWHDKFVESYSSDILERKIFCWLTPQIIYIIIHKSTYMNNIMYYEVNSS